MRVKAVISYDGSRFHGFQRQKSTKLTVAGALEEALKSLNIEGGIVGSGRTDAGVHASGQVVHFDLPPYWKDLSRLTQHLGRKLDGIAIKHIIPVSDTFHARFDARSRVYRYVFKTNPVSVFEERYITSYVGIDTALLQSALKLFEGKHDFRNFHKTGSDVHSTLREIQKTVYRRFGDLHLIYFYADGFLRSQVRMMVHASMLCASGRLRHEELREQIDAGERYTSEAAPASGLYLCRVVY